MDNRVHPTAQPVPKVPLAPQGAPDGAQERIDEAAIQAAIRAAEKGIRKHHQPRFRRQNVDQRVKQLAARWIAQLDTNPGSIEAGRLTHFAYTLMLVMNVFLDYNAFNILLETPLPNGSEVTPKGYLRLFTDTEDSRRTTLDAEDDIDESQWTFDVVAHQPCTSDPSSCLFLTISVSPPEVGSLRSLRALVEYFELQGEDWRPTTTAPVFPPAGTSRATRRRTRRAWHQHGALSRERMTQPAGPMLPPEAAPPVPASAAPDPAPAGPSSSLAPARDVQIAAPPQFKRRPSPGDVPTTRVEGKRSLDLVKPLELSVAQCSELTKLVTDIAELKTLANSIAKSEERERTLVQELDSFDRRHAAFRADVQELTPKLAGLTRDRHAALHDIEQKEEGVKKARTEAETARKSWQDRGPKLQKFIDRFRSRFDSC